MSDLFKKYKNDIFTVINVGLGIFITAGLWSYNPKDPSFNSLGTSLKATNYCGVAGSFVSDLLLQLFGVVAWSIPIIILIQTGLNFLGKEKKQSPLTFYFLVIMIMSSLGALLNSYWPGLEYYEKNISLGGTIGYSMLKGLVALFNPVGAQIILWSLLLIEFVVFFERNLRELLIVPIGVALGSLKFIYKKVISFVSVENSFKKVLAVERAQEATETGEKKSKIKFDLPFKKKKETEALKTEQNGIQKPKEQEQGLGFKIFKETPIAEAKQIKFDEPKKIRLPKKVENWVMPKLELLDNPPESRLKVDKNEIQKKANMLKEKLLNFSIEGEITEAKPGPLVTMYEFKPNADVKISKISELEDDLSLALSSESVRVVGHIPGRDVVGIETSNIKRETVFYKELISENEFWKDEFTLPMALGRNVEGEPRIVDLRKMPHLLIAGTTGSGKSVFVASIISGLIYKHSPKTLRMVLVDPKMVDLAHFAKIPHLILPHITESKKAVSALRWSVREMEKRYRSLSQFGASKIEAYNQTVSELTIEQIKQHEEESENRYYFKPLPYIVIVIDELADLMVSEKQNIEQPIQRLTQMARACGMHLIIATQSPRKDVVTGLIKTNIPGRIALKVSSKMDSRIILDDSGAERLLPNGDMLFLAPGVNKPTRHHGPFLADKEIQRLVQFWSGQGEPEYDALGLKSLEGFSNYNDGTESENSDSYQEEYDEKYDEILSWASEQKEVSASLIQRRFRLGYPRAARIIEIFEKEGVVGPANGSKPRQVIINPMPHL